MSIKNKSLKKPIITLSIIMLFVVFYVLYTQYERRFLRTFAFNIVNDEILYKDIIQNQLICDEKSKETATFFLDFYRTNYKQNINFIYIVSNNEVLFFSKFLNLDRNLIQEDKGLIYFVFINGNTFPVLINEQNKIIAISTIQKGKNVYFMKM